MLLVTVGDGSKVDQRLTIINGEIYFLETVCQR